MNFDQMLEAIKAGKRCTHPKVSKGWVVAWSNRLDQHYWINPHTGSEPLFPFSPTDKAATDWRVVE